MVLERTDSLTWLSLRNAGEVHIVAVDQLNTYDVIAADDIVFTRGAYDAFVGTSKGSAPAATSEPRTEAEPKPESKTEAKTAAPKAETATDTADEAEPTLPKGAKAPLKSARAPKGYEVMGSESGVYREADAAGYDIAAADFWFKSVEDAEAAGLTRADEKETDQ